MSENKTEIVDLTCDSLAPSDTTEEFKAFFSQHREEYMDAFLETYKETMLEMEKHYNVILKMKDDKSVQVDPHATMCDKPTAEQLPSHVTYSYYKTALQELETCEDEELKKNYQEQKEIFESLWHDYNKMNAYSRFQRAFSILEKAYHGTNEKIHREHKKVLELQKWAENSQAKKKRKIT